MVEPLSVDGRRSRLKYNIETFLMVWNLSKPVIAAVNGYALGGACELVQVCDVKIASDQAMLGEPEIRLGYGAPFLITPYSINLAMAKEMMLTGDIVDANEAARLGMVNRVVSHDDLITECERVAHKMRNISAIGIKTTKISVNRALESAGFLSALNHKPGVDDPVRHGGYAGARRIRPHPRRAGLCGPRWRGAGPGSRTDQSLFREFEPFRSTRRRTASSMACCVAAFWRRSSRNSLTNSVTIWMVSSARLRSSANCCSAK